ncbi:unnamed protein product [Closterium sp. NIES-53]
MWENQRGFYSLRCSSSGISSSSSGISSSSGSGISSSSGSGISNRQREELGVPEERRGSEGEEVPPAVICLSGSPGIMWENQRGFYSLRCSSSGISSSSSGISSSSGSGISSSSGSGISNRQREELGVPEERGGSEGEEVPPAVICLSGSPGIMWENQRGLYSLRCSSSGISRSSGSGISSSSGSGISNRQ